MSAVVVAVDTPYYGLSDRKGSVAIQMYLTEDMNFTSGTNEAFLTI